MTNRSASLQTRTSQPVPPILWLILILLFCLLVAVESYALYTIFTSKFTGANDFFVRWLGGREYLLHGTNPFDQSVAEKAQRAMFGRLAQPGDKDEAYFAYPLYTFYFFWPLSLLPYAWAQAIWMTLLQFMLLAITVLSIRLARWQPPSWLFVATILWGIFFYNGARAIILGQFSIVVGLALLAALWAIEQRRDVWAGVLLSVTTIKPQMVFLVLIFLLLWSLTQRRWTVVIGFGVSMAVLVASSMLLVPTWPLDFVNNALAYSDYVAFGTPLENLLHFVLPASIAEPLTIILSVLFFLTLIPGWWLALSPSSFPIRFLENKSSPPTPLSLGEGSRASDGVKVKFSLPVAVPLGLSDSWQKMQAGAYTWAVASTLIVGSLITFRSATTNQIILYLPLFLFFRRLTEIPNLQQRWSNLRWADLVSVAIQTGLLLLMWTVFAITLEGNWEHVMMHGLLPALMLLLYIVDWRNLWGTATLLEQKEQSGLAT